MTAMALTSQRSRTSRTSRTLRRLSLKLGTLVIAALAVTMALGLAAPAVGQAAVSVQRLGYCGGGDLGPPDAPERKPLQLLRPPSTGDTSCEPAAGPAKPPLQHPACPRGGTAL